MRLSTLIPLLTVATFLFPAPALAMTEVLDPAADATYEAPDARVATPGQKKARKAARKSGKKGGKAARQKKPAAKAKAKAKANPTARRR